jgi:GDP-L-fucose synthase
MTIASPPTGRLALDEHFKARKLDTARGNNKKREGTMDALTHRKIIVIGGDGFLGNYVVQLLEDYGVRNMFIPRSKHYDLTDPDNAHRLFRDYPPDQVIHLASTCPLSGQISELADPASDPDLIMWRNILLAAEAHNNPEIVKVWDYHAYPEWCPTPYSECDAEDLSRWSQSSQCKSPSELFLLDLLHYNDQRTGGCEVISFINSEIYGPGDRFHAQGRRRLPSTIRSISDAKEQGEPVISIPGNPNDMMDHLYVCDAASAIVNAIANHQKTGIMNVASGQCHRWAEVVERIIAYLEYPGDIMWMEHERTPCNISMRIDRARDTIGYQPEADFEEALKETVQWFSTHRRFILENEADMHLPWHLNGIWQPNHRSPTNRNDTEPGEL